MKDFLLDLSQTSRFEFQLWTADKGLVFSSKPAPSVKDFQGIVGEFAKKIICGNGFQQDRFQEVGAVWGLPLKNGNDAVGSLTTYMAGLNDPPQPPEKGRSQHPPIKEIKIFLTHLAQIIEAQLSTQIETEKMTEELSRSYEDLCLYSKIDIQNMPLNFSGKSLYGLIEDLLETMRSDLAFAWFADNPDFNAVVVKNGISDKISDPAAYVQTLINKIPLEANTLKGECFIIGNSQTHRVYRKLHPEPFRFLAVAIETNENLYGWMGLISFNMNEIFRQSELKLLKSLAASSAIAFENSRLYIESVKMANKERYVRNIFQKYVPEAVAKKILDRGDRDLITLGEKRLVTLLNVDMRGYSRMSKKLQSEDVVSILNYFFMTMGSAVLNHNGILDKFLGDGVLAVFGAPVESANSSLDAALAALEMREEVEKVNAFARERYGVTLSMGVSINTGEAIVGNIGFEKKMEYTVIGGVVNDTFRLQDFTREKPNSILVSKSTHKKIKSFISARSIGIKTLGANEGRMEVFEVLGPRELPAGKA